MYEGNNSVFNGNSPSTPTFSPAPAYAYPPKKSKKKFIIIIALILILVGLGTAAYFLVPKLVAPSSPTWASVSKAFNRYSNWIFYGKESDQNSESEFDFTKTYEIHRISNSPRDKIIDWYNEADSLLQSFLEEYRAAAYPNSDQVISTDHLPADVDESLHRLIIFHRDLFRFVYIFRTANYITSEMIQEKFINSGETATVAFIKERYASWTKDESMSIREYGSVLVQQALLTVDYLSIIYDAGCINSQTQTIDPDCVIQEIDDALIQTNREQQRDIGLALVDLMPNVSQLLGSTWSISEQLSAKVGNK